jgi:2-dehydropantoate 2-reductase
MCAGEDRHGLKPEHPEGSLSQRWKCCATQNRVSQNRITESGVRQKRVQGRQSTGHTRDRLSQNQRQSNHQIREISQNMNDQLRHSILGAGGVGGLMGASLARIGAAVTMIVRPESLPKFPRQLRLESPFGNFDADVTTAVEVPPVDVLWITVKATQLDSALTSLTHPESVKAIVPLLNGVDHLSQLRSKYGREKVIAATIAVESERVAPGHIVHRSSFARLNISSAGRVLLGATVEQLQRLGFECRFIDDEPTLMWSKLVFLAAFALTTTAADKGTGEILADPEWRQLGLACIREASAVAGAEGAKIDADAVIASVMKMPGNMRSSMQKDVEQGKAPELDAIAGPILRGARRYGIEIPATKKLVAAVEQRVGAAHSIL